MRLPVSREPSSDVREPVAAPVAAAMRRGKLRTLSGSAPFFPTHLGSEETSRTGVRRFRRSPVREPTNLAADTDLASGCAEPR